MRGMKVCLLIYPPCSTCRDACRWLERSGISFEVRNIVEENPTAEELREWWQLSGLPLRRFFNTSGMKYREMKLSAALPGMSEEEQLALLASDGMLVKRPLLITEKGVVPGFKAEAWFRLFS